MALNRRNSEVSNALVDGVKKILSRRSAPWIGTMTELDSAVRGALRNKLPENWPVSPSVLRLALNVVVNRLRNAGVSVRFSRSTDRTRTRLVRFSNT